MVSELKSMELVVVVINVPRGFFDFLENIFEKRDLSGTGWVSVFERERTRRVRNSFAEVDELVVWDFPDGIVNDAMGVVGLPWRTTLAESIFADNSLLPTGFPPPGPDVSLFAGEEPRLDSVGFVDGFFSLLLCRDEKAAWIRVRFDVESVLGFFNDWDRLNSAWSFPALASF